MKVKQLSVFVENRKGNLVPILEHLSRGGVDISALSLADTTEYGLLRLIVNDPVTCKEKLSEAGFSTMLTRVLVVKITHQSGSLQDLLRILADANISVEYMYGLSIDGADASVVIKTSDLVLAEEILRQKGTSFLTSEDVARM